MLNFVSKFIPTKVLVAVIVVLLQVSLLYLVHNEGYVKGVHTERLENTAKQKKAIELEVNKVVKDLDKLLIINKEKDKIIENRDKSINEARAYYENLQRGLGDVVNTLEDTDCSNIDNEYYRVYQQLYNRTAPDTAGG